MAAVRRTNSQDDQSSAFEALLQQLRDEHMREVGLLRGRLRRSQQRVSDLSLPPLPDADFGDTPRVIQEKPKPTKLLHASLHANREVGSCSNGANHYRNAHSLLSMQSLQGDHSAPVSLDDTTAIGEESTQVVQLCLDNEPTEKRQRGSVIITSRVTAVDCEEVLHSDKRWKRLVRLLNPELAMEEDGFEIRECWVVSKRRSSRVSNKMSMTQKLTRESGLTNYSSYADNFSPISKEQKKAMLRRTKSAFRKGSRRNESYIMLPFSGKRLSWDVITMLLVGYNMFILPIHIFELEFFGDEPVWLAILFGLFWATDIMLSFMTGFVIDDDGGLEMRPKEIAKNYARTRLPLDLTLVSIDWIMIIVLLWHGSGAGRQIFGFLKILRLIRLTQVVRLFKFNKILDSLRSRLNSNQVNLYFGLIRIVLLLCLGIHVIGCLWYGLGKTAQDSWINEEWMILSSGEYHYLTSVHWAMSQIHGTMEVTAGNGRERIFSILIGMMCFFASASFVAGMTNILVQIESLKMARTVQERSLRKFLADHKVSTQLGLRVKRLLRFYFEKKCVKDQELELFALLPDNVLAELHMELRLPVLVYHPFFNDYNQQLPRAMVTMCHRGIDVASFMGGDIIFHCGEVASQMFFCVEGLLDYRCAQLAFMVYNSKQEPETKARRSSQSWAPNLSRSSQLRRMSQMMSNSASTADMGASKGLSSEMVRRRSLVSMPEEDTLRDYEIVKRESAEAPNDLLPLHHLEHVSPGQWVSEASLWLYWVHVGELSVSSDCNLFSVDSAEFEELIANQPGSLPIAMSYATKFLRFMQAHQGTDYNLREFAGRPIHEVDKKSDWEAFF